MKKVAIIGAGYGGLRAVEHLVQHKNISIYLFDKNSYHYLQTEAYGYIAGRFDLQDVALDLKNWCNGFDNKINFIQKEVLFINSDQKKVKTDDKEYEYDYLIIATGSQTNFFSFIDGLKENAFGVKKLFRSHHFRTQFEQMLYKKLDDTSYQGKSINLAIGGAGLSGVEIAAEMANIIKKHTKSIGESANEVKIHLIDASHTILHGMDPYIIKYTKKRLDDLNVNILTNTFITRVDNEKIHFKDETTLEYTFLIFTGGIVSKPIESDFEYKTNKISQYITDNKLRLNDSIFAIGDCCELRDTKSYLLPPTAQSAEKSAEYVAKSILDIESDKAPEVFKASIDGVFVALGGNYAAGVLFDFIKVRGYVAFLLKKFITKSYFIGLKLRINTGFKKRTINS
jgi:NADH dehydrogenase